MIFRRGRILQAVWDQKTYRIAFDNRFDATASVLDIGVEAPLDVGEEVLCFHSDETGWIILGRLPVPAKISQDDIEKSEERRIVEQHQKLVGQYVTGEDDSGKSDTGLPNYVGKDEEVLDYGDTQIASKQSGAFVRTDSAGSILAVVSNILCFVLSKGAAILRAKQYLLDILPGFRFKIHSPDEQKMPAAQDQAQKSKKTAMRVEATLQSDQDEDKIDFDIEAGALAEADDTGYGKGRDSTAKKISRGLRFRFGDFGVCELDNKVNEARITFLFGETGPETELYQLRFAPKEAVLSWGQDQFVSFTKDGLLIKAKSIGVAGPWVMWDPAKVTSFQHNKDLAATEWSSTCEWDATQAKPGIRFKKSVYFGDSGKPAITEDFIDNVFSTVLQTIDAHVHNVTMVGAPTGPMIPPTKVIADALIMKGPTRDMFLSVVTLAV